jgi:hypothetical protein
MNKLRESKVADHVTEAVLAAFHRCQELGRGVALDPKQ